jgi:hypothetical protein
MTPNCVISRMTPLRYNKRLLQEVEVYPMAPARRAVPNKSRQLLGKAIKIQRRETNVLWRIRNTTVGTLRIMLSPLQSPLSSTNPYPRQNRKTSAVPSKNPYRNNLHIINQPVSPIPPEPKSNDTHSLCAPISGSSPASTRTSERT